MSNDEIIRQVQGRLFGKLGIQAEPVFIVGGHGGFGFTAGPSYFPEYPWDEVRILKVEQGLTYDVNPGLGFGL